MGSCVIYVLLKEHSLNDQTLRDAQGYAINHKLPLAVVTCLNIDQNDLKTNQKALHSLKSTENQLKQYNIPFMMLLGDSYDRLQGVFYHLKPKAVFFDNDTADVPKKLLSMLINNADFKVMAINLAKTTNINNIKLQKHPYTWQGPIITLNQLIDLLQKAHDTSQPIC